MSTCSDKSGYERQSYETIYLSEEFPDFTESP